MCGGRPSRRWPITIISRLPAISWRKPIVRCGKSCERYQQLGCEYRQSGRRRRPPARRTSKAMVDPHVGWERDGRSLSSDAIASLCRQNEIVWQIRHHVRRWLGSRYQACQRGGVCHGFVPFASGAIDGRTICISGVDRPMRPHWRQDILSLDMALPPMTRVVSVSGTSVQLSKNTTVNLPIAQFVAFTPQQMFLLAVKRSQAWATAMLTFFNQFGSGAGMPAQYVHSELRWGHFFPDGLRIWQHRMGRSRFGVATRGSKKSSTQLSTRSHGS